MTTNGQWELFKRHEDNPLVTVGDIPYPANTVFNAAATRVGSETLLLLRVEDRRGLSHLTVARSDDGITDWRIDALPAFPPSPETHPEEVWGVEDPRITYIEEKQQWFIAYTAYSGEGPRVSLAATRDFESFERFGPITLPEDKDAALFPVRFNGRFAMIHRPVASFQDSSPSIWISFSPDLKHWGDYQVLLKAKPGNWWDSRKIGLGPPPLLTSEGWLIGYHGVRETASGRIYRIGLALLDLEDPTRLIRRCSEWVLAPKEKYERIGDVDDVIFPCGWILEGDEIKLYYGAADTCIVLATASLKEVLRYLRK